jgi:hypothetical protein
MLFLLAAPETGLLPKHAASGGEPTVTPEEFAHALSTLTAPPPVAPTRAVVGTPTEVPGGYGAQPLPTTSAADDTSASNSPAPQMAPEAQSQGDAAVPTVPGASSSAPQFSITRIPTEAPAPVQPAPAGSPSAGGSAAAGATPEATPAGAP